MPSPQIANLPQPTGRALGTGDLASISQHRGKASSPLWVSNLPTCSFVASSPRTAKVNTSTSAARALRPIVVGTIALMFEVNPSLTTEQVRAILHSTAVVDEHTGAVPNNHRGYGKLDIKAAVAAAAGE